MSSWIIRSYLYPQNSEILDMPRNVKSTCISLVHGNAAFHVYYLYITFQILQCNYRQTTNIMRTLIGNELADLSGVVEASTVGAASITSSFLTWYLVSIDCTKAATRRDGKHWRFGFGASYIIDLTNVKMNLCIWYQKLWISGMIPSIVGWNLMWITGIGNHGAVGVS